MSTTASSPNEEIAELRALLDAALARIEHLEARAPSASTLAPPVPWPDVVDRRRALKGAALAAGATAAGLVLGDARPAAAANGSSLVLGTQVQSATSPTAFAVSGTGVGLGLGVVDNSRASYTGSPCLAGHAKGQAFDIAVDGFAEGAATAGSFNATNGNAVWARSSAGMGVNAASTSSTAVYGSGGTNGVYGVATSGTGVRGQASSGAGVFGTSSTNFGVRGESAASVGVYGTSTSDYAIYGYSTGSTGVGGRTSSSQSTAMGVEGSASNGYGVRGRSTAGTGVYGEVTGATGFGVQAVAGSSTGLRALGKVYGASVETLSSNPAEAAVLAKSQAAMAVLATADTGLVMSGVSDQGGGVEVKAPKFHLRLANAATRGAPTADAFAHQAGEIVQSSAGETWVCVKGGTPGTWRKVAGQSSAGQFHVLATPARIYDSRPGTSPSQGPKTKLTGNVARVIDATHNSSGVPKGATAITFALFLVNAYNGNGNMTVWANGVARPASNTCVWGAGSGRYTTSAISAVDAAAKIQIAASASTDVVIDVVGYYR